MIKAGIIVGFIAMFFAVGVALLSPVCVPCVALLLGIAAGFLGGMFEKPAEGKETTRVGGLAGLISGIGIALGQLIGAIVNSQLVGPDGAAEMMRNFGLQGGGAGAFENSYWVGVVASTVCFGLLDIVLMAGLGVVGALMWGKFMRKNDRPGQY